MDITNFIITRRNHALLVGDYGLYRTQLSRRLLTVRRKLGRTSPKGRKYTPKAPITAEDISSNDEFVHLSLLSSERAWAHAMYMKSMHSSDSAAHAISGSTRKHIISRLHKATVLSGQLVKLLESKNIALGTARTILEARAYHSLLRGALEFESQKWEKSLEAYSEAHLIYTSLARPVGATQDDGYRELLSSTVDPSIRYAAYQLRLARTLPIEKIVSRFLPKSSNDIYELLQSDPSTSKESTASAESKAETSIKDLPSTIAWRSRTVKIEDANIAQGLAAVSAAEQRLASLLSSTVDMTSKEKAAAYDEVLIPSQDAVDATKTAIDELTNDGVARSDPRMQALQITRTAVNYALVGWRIGRNRVLCGRDDGAHMDAELTKKKLKKPTGDKPNAGIKEESNGRKLARLRERVALYDTTLQSLESIKELPGVAADEGLLEELELKRCYFSALRCLSISHSHTLLSTPNPKASLALLSRALHLSTSVKPPPTTPQTLPTGKPASLDLSITQLQALQTILQSLVNQHRALLDLQHIQTVDIPKSQALKPADLHAVPVIERLDEYVFPQEEDLLKRLVDYPPKVKPIPVKPIFLDVAWNYIEYPGRGGKGAGQQAASAGTGKIGEKSDGKGTAKKGWFGFGR